MTRQRYSAVEALNRILRVLKGSTPPTDIPGQVDGELLSTNEAISDIAELLAGSLPGESLNIPGGTFSGAIDTSSTITTTSTLTAEDIVANDSGSFDNLMIGTGTFYGGGSRVGIGGFSEPELYGNGRIVLAIGPASTLPSGTLAHLGGVLFADGGSLKWLGSSGTVTTIAGS